MSDKSANFIWGNMSKSKDNVSFQSEWPLFLMLDEVWLRVRRALVHKLEAERLWPSTKEYKNYMEKRKKLGDKITSETLIDVFGTNDYAYLNSESIFGASNRQFRYKLPYIASFGYEVGSTMYNLNGKDETDAFEVSKICSVFNIGISIFDHINDTEPELFNNLKNIINEKALLKISTNKKACESLQTECNTISSTELRLLLKIILWFFLKLHSHYIQSGKENLRKRLISHVLSAYDAEIASSNHNKYSKTEAFNISRNKSMLPFLVIYLITRLPDSSTIEKSENDFNSFMTNMGEIFWLVDDLVDVIRDLESNHLNSVLIQVNDKIDDIEISQIQYKILVELLNGDYIETQANQIYSKIYSVLNFLESKKFREEDIKMVKNLIVFSVRNWME